jgi:membrane-bound lytic murein transglycosylase D
VPTDSTLQVLAAANARYARQAQERAAREIAQAQELARVKKQLAARAAAQQRLSIAQAAAAAKASTATRLGMPTDSAATEDAAVATASAPALPQTARMAKRRESLRAATSRQPEPTASLAAATEPGSASDDALTSARPSRSNGATLPAEGRATSRPVAETRRAKEEKTEPETAFYTVRPGDNLTKLAQAQGVSIEQLKAWNKLTTETVLAGQQLRLAAPADATALPVAVQAAAPRRAKASLGAAPKLETHTVQPGDTLFSIAKRFGITLAELKRLNHLASDQVKLGQKLVVGG